MRRGIVWRAGLAGVIAVLTVGAAGRPGAASAATPGAKLPVPSLPSKPAKTDPGSAIPGTASNFQLVGHAPLYDRGENAALTIYGHYVYIGSRTDSEAQHLHPGVLVVDAGDPRAPKVVHEIKTVDVDPRMVDGYTSRELRVWPQQKLLMVIYMFCSDILHQCAANGDLGAGPNFQQIAFFDLSTPANPRLVTTFSPAAMPHELFLWIDPANPSGRALLYSTSPNAGSRGLSLTVIDLSHWRQKQLTELTHLDLTAGITASIAPPASEFCPLPDDGTATCYDVRLHSISLTPDGRTLFLAHLGGGFLIADTGELADGLANPQIHLITPIANRVFWDNQGAHSAVKLPGRPYVLTTEEIYGKMGFVGTQAFGRALSGCPWGWVRIIDISDMTHPRLVSQYKIDKNQQTYCTAPTSPKYVTVMAEDQASSYASHNPTVLPDLALVTWHSGGLRAVDLTDPTKPSGDGFFLPTPNVDSVTPDPALEPGSNGVIAWSYPIIKDGLIYYIDIRNGLYIVRYTGPHADEVSQRTFLEGNSNRGDAWQLEYGTPPPAGLATAEEAGAAIAVSSPAGATLPMTGGSSGAVPGAAAGLLAVLGVLGVGARRRRTA